MHDAENVYARRLGYIKDQKREPGYDRTAYVAVHDGVGVRESCHCFKAFAYRIQEMVP